MRKRLPALVAFIILFITVLSFMFFLKKMYVVPVLMYHSIDHNDKETKLSVSPESFERQMKFLHDHGYNVVELHKIISYLRNKEKAPPKTIAVTFDDGFYNNYQHAYPVLKKYNIPATLFVIVNKIGEPGYVGWKEIKEMSDSGIISIQSHTISHKWLPSMGTKQLREELALSKSTLEKELGKNIDVLCYPVGAHNDRVKRETAGAGYACAVATNPGKDSPSYDIYSIKRIRISRTSDNPLVFWLETSGYYTWIKEHRDD